MHSGAIDPSLFSFSVRQDGDKFWRMPECYIRGSTIKYLRIPDEIIDMVKEEVVSKGRGRGGMQQQKQQKGRGVGSTGRGKAHLPKLKGVCPRFGHCCQSFNPTALD